jgi:O-6-methylguanine DNA methyltransferase
MRKRKLSNFQNKVLGVVSRIPRGKTLSYKEVAKLAGCPLAWRAVGNVLKKNYNSKIPCHRVIRSNFLVGGYNRGAFAKIALLRKEGVKIKKGKVL